MKWPEKLLHFIWRYKLITQANLMTSQGEALRILDFGQYNVNAGADFEYAKIQINDRIWVGNIELHLSAIDWKHHRHHLDPRYNATILHVVWENTDSFEIKRLDGTSIPTLALADYVDQALLHKYMSLMQNEQWIACENQLHRVSNVIISNWIDRLVIERLEARLELVDAWAKHTSYNWEKVQLIALSRAFGMQVNSDAFEKLMMQFNPNLLYKYADQSFLIEALLFGVAGFLSSVPHEDNYTKKLKDEFHYLKNLHGLQNLTTIEWKFLRMRPYNFPTFRLAQFSGLLAQRIQWFEFAQISSLNELMSNLSKVQVSNYWSNHFHFSKESVERHSTILTNDFICHIIINAFVPVLFSYGRHVGNQDLQLMVMDWLHQLPAEKNSIIKKYKERSINANTAEESQALLYLYKNYCSAKKCLDCAIGHAVLSR